MGIKVEFNPDLALRIISEFKIGRRKIEECIPENLKAGEVYDFLKRAQRNYWLHGEIPLRITSGNEKLSRPIASIIILEATHFIDAGEVWTRGKYKAIEIFTDNEIHFEALDIIK
jgi:hypothetical protein